MTLLYIGAAPTPIPGQVSGTIPRKQRLIAKLAMPITILATTSTRKVAGMLAASLACAPQGRREVVIREDPIR